MTFWMLVENFGDAVEILACVLVRCCINSVLRRPWFEFPGQVVRKRLLTRVPEIQWEDVPFMQDDDMMEQFQSNRAEAHDK